MAKVFGIHRLELKPGVNAAEFEQVVAGEFNTLPQGVPGWQASIVKGDRGNEVGQYLLIFEIESVQARDKAIPGDGTLSPEAQQAMAQAAPVFDKLNGYLTHKLGEETPFTDYVAVGT